MAHRRPAAGLAAVASLTAGGGGWPHCNLQADGAAQLLPQLLNAHQPAQDCVRESRAAAPVQRSRAPGQKLGGVPHLEGVKRCALPSAEGAVSDPSSVLRCVRGLRRRARGCRARCEWHRVASSLRRGRRAPRSAQRRAVGGVDPLWHAAGDARRPHLLGQLVQVAVDHRGPWRLWAAAAAARHGSGRRANSAGGRLHRSLCAASCRQLSSQTRACQHQSRRSRLLLLVVHSPRTSSAFCAVQAAGFQEGGGLRTAAGDAPVVNWQFESRSRSAR
jgi:hypothetical protein